MVSTSTNPTWLVLHPTNHVLLSSSQVLERVPVCQTAVLPLRPGGLLSRGADRAHPGMDLPRGRWRGQGIFYFYFYFLAKYIKVLPTCPTYYILSKVSGRGRLHPSLPLPHLRRHRPVRPHHGQGQERHRQRAAGCAANSSFGRQESVNLTTATAVRVSHIPLLYC